MSSPSPPIIPTCFKGLPICDAWDELKAAIKEHQVVIVTGETGSGKTTQLPKICLAAGRGRKRQIACTQPRRIAAISVAERVAAELGTWGRRHVGYKIRFSRSTDRHTRIKFITDGMLLAEMQKDRYLRTYDTIIVDEAHERSLNTDFILGALRRLVKKRHDLKVIITSATMDTDKFMDAFKGAVAYHIGGRGYPVDIIYREPQRDDKGREPCLVDATVEAVRDIVRTDLDGDILVFLPTESDIMETVRILSSSFQNGQYLKGQAVDVLPIYGRLSASEQRRIFRYTQRRKIVVATNIAETSITVPGITYVVDSGLARISHYSISSRTRALPVLPISKASAMQRAGRAGRVKPGICIRLYSEEDFEARRDYTPPEILRSNLAEVILRLSAMGLGSAENFPFIDPPSRQAIREGMTTLREIGAIDIRGRITKIGRIMACMPIDPRIARVILQARNERCLHPALIVAAALSIQDPRERPSEKQEEADKAHAGFADPESDFCTFINIWQAFHQIAAREGSRNSMRRLCRKHFLSWNRMQEWSDIFRQFIQILREAGLINHTQKTALENMVMTPHHLSKKTRERLHRSVLAGFLSHAAVRTETGEYMAARGREVHIFPGSALFRLGPQWLVAVEFVRTSRLFARTAAVIRPEWIEEIGAQFCRHHIGEPHWSRQQGEAVATEKVTLWGLTVVEARSINYKKIDRKRAREVFITQGLAQANLRKRFAFMQHNASLLKEYLEMEARTRQHGVLADQEVLAEFYRTTLSELEKTTGKFICGEADLSRAIKLAGDDHKLRLTKEFLEKHCRIPEELSMFPGHIEVCGHTISLTYRFQVGDPADGVTARIPVHILEDMEPARFEWLVPGLLKEKVEALLKGLPKKARKALVPVPRTVSKIVPVLKQDGRSIRQALEDALMDTVKMHITRDMWPDEQALPAHLRMHFQVIDQGNKTIISGDNLRQLHHKLCGTRRYRGAAMPDTREIREVRDRWERQGIILSNYTDLPDVIEAGKKGSVTRLFPAVACRGQRVDIVLTTSRNESARLTRRGITRLVVSELEAQFRYIKKMCSKTCKECTRKAMQFSAHFRALSDNTFDMICTELTDRWDCPPARRTLQDFIHDLRPRMVMDAQKILELVHQAVLVGAQTFNTVSHLRSGRFAGPSTLNIANALESDIGTLFPKDFPARITPDELKHYPRYLRAIEIMAQRTEAAPAKQKQKLATLQPVSEIFTAAHTYSSSDQTELTEIEEEMRSLLKMCRELMVSVYAPELGAAKGVSVKRVKKMWDEIKS